MIIGCVCVSVCVCVCIISLLVATSKRTREMIVEKRVSPPNANVSSSSWSGGSSSNISHNGNR